MVTERKPEITGRGKNDESGSKPETGAEQPLTFGTAKETVEPELDFFKVEIEGFKVEIEGIRGHTSFDEADALFGKSAGMDVAAPELELDLHVPDSSIGAALDFQEDPAGDEDDFDLG